MVIPLGGMAEPEHQETPEAIREYHSCWWYLLVVLLTATSIGCCVAFKIFDALITLFIGIWAYYLVKDRCKEMSQSCLFSFCFMCTIQAVFELIILLMSLPGRRTQQTTQQPAQHGPHGGHSSTYTVTTKITPFFSDAEGWHYNFQSWMMIASVVVFIYGALLSKSSYGEYETSLFDDREEGRAIGGGGGGYRGGGGGGYYGGGGPPTRPANTGAQRFGGGGNVATFGGTGQRLGS